MTAISTMAARPLPDTVAGGLDGAQGKIPALTRALDLLTADVSVLAEWFTGFVETERAAEVAMRSYWHHNGFAKLVLHVADEFRIRMHVWPEGQHRLGETNPHGHRWNFVSTVLCGDGLETEEYQESGRGERHVRYRYSGGLNSLRPTGEIGLKTLSTTKVRTGERHAVDTDVIHTVHPLGTAMVATLVVQSRPLVQNTPVYCVPGKPVDEPIVAITPDEVRGLLHQVLTVGSERG